MDPTSTEQELDSDIASIRREIRKLHRRRRILASSILSSSTLQSRLASFSTRSSSLNDISPLAESAGTHARLNHHRIAFSATTFPFRDPAPNTETPRLLGVRIDLSVQNGRYPKPYYILLKRIRVPTSDNDNATATGDENATAKGNGNGKETTLFQIHRHTIPAFVPMDRLSRTFLPVPTPTSTSTNDPEEEPPLKPKSQPPPRPQNLRGLVRELRRHLVTWHLRVDAVNHLRETLGVERRRVSDYAPDDGEGVWEPDLLADESEGRMETRIRANDLGIVSLGATSLEAAYVRVEWEDGRVGRFKISPSGMVERAVVIGDLGRDKGLEGVLTGGDGRVEGVLGRLRGYVPPSSPTASASPSGSGSSSGSSSPASSRAS